MAKKNASTVTSDQVKDVILETTAVMCKGSAMAMRYAADKAEDAAKYCRSHKTGKFSFGLKFSVGDHEFCYGSAAK